MTASSGRVAWVGLWLALAATAGMGLVFLFGQKTRPLADKTLAPSFLMPATTQAATTQPVVVIQTYGQLLHADLPNYPQTQPWAIPVDLSDAAALIIKEPIYVCSNGNLWITRPDADPLPTVLARAGGESEHIVDRPIDYIIWAINRRGVWEPSAICPQENGFEIISAKQSRPIPWHRPYRWDMASTWDDGGDIRLIIPTDDGISIITVGKDITEDYCRLLDGAPTTQRDIPPPRVLFDLRGLLAWIPADGNFIGSTRVARYLDGKWQYLDVAAWPADILHLVPMLDGSVLQIRRGPDPASVQLTIVALDAPAINEKEIDDLTDQLGDDDPDKRVAAYQRLTQYGPGIYPILEKLSANASPEAQVRIRQLLEGKLATKLGGLLINGNQLTVAARLHDGGVVFFAPQGVSIPQEGQDPKVVSPDYLAVRPGRPVQELPPVVVDRLSKSNGSITGMRDEWMVTTPDIGPARYLPPNQLVPLLRETQRNFSRLTAIDGRGRWLLRDPSSQRTLILDPTVPDPTPRLAIWLIDGGNGAGWNKADWPAILRGTAHWIVNEKDWQPMDEGENIQTEAPKIVAPPIVATRPSTTTTTAPDTTPDNGPLLMIDSDGTRYYDGRLSLTTLTSTGKRRAWTLPDSCAGSEDQPAWLVGDRQGHLFLFNSIGRIARLRATPTDAQPFVLEAVFAQSIPDFHDIQRIWCDPSGRIDVVYEGSHVALIFPSGQVPPDIADKILPQDLRRIDSP